MRYENQGRSNPRVRRRYNPNRRNTGRRNQDDGNDQKPRRFKSRNAEEGGRRFRKAGRNKTRKIQRDQRVKDKKKDRDDLDREMREYWVKTGSAKGKAEEKN